MITRTLADLAASIGQSPELSLIVKATVALTIGLAVTRLAPRARSSVRHLVLGATLGSLLVLPVAAAFAAPFVIEVPVAPRTEGARVVKAEPGSRAAVAEPAPARRPSRATSTLPQMTAGTLLKAAWALGTLLALASLVASLYKLTLIRRNGMPWLDAPEFVRQIAARAGRRPIAILLHEAVAVPLTCGVMRPAILLPSAARRWSEDDIRRALVHEVEHIHRVDWLSQLTARATCALYWFHPLAWTALRRLCLEAERACDDAVVRGTERTEYAEQLVALAEQLRAGSKPPVLAMASRSDLATRISSLLDATRTRGRAGLLPTIATAGVAAIGVLAIAPVRAVGAPAEPVVTTAGTQSTSAQQSERRGTRSDRQILRAAARGDVEQIASLINAGANVNATIDGDGSPLIVAAREGHLPAVALLLDRGADPNLAVEGDGNPLIMAAREGRLDVVTLLLTRGAGIDQMVDGDENALIQASGSGHLDIVKLLVAKGADVNARVWAEGSSNGRDGAWRTPLSMARKGRHEAVVAVLRAAGARE